MNKTVKLELKLDFSTVTFTALKRYLDNFGGFSLDNAYLMIRDKASTDSVMQKINLVNGIAEITFPDSCSQISGRVVFDKNIDCKHNNFYFDLPFDNSVFTIPVSDDMLTVFVVSKIWAASKELYGVKHFQSLFVKLTNKDRSCCGAGMIYLGAGEYHRSVNTIAHEIGHAIDWRLRGFKNLDYFKTWAGLFMSFEGDNWDYIDYQKGSYYDLSDKNKKGIIFMESPSDFNGNLFSLKSFYKNFTDSMLFYVDDLLVHNYTELYGADELSDKLKLKLKNNATIKMLVSSDTEAEKIKTALFLSNREYNADKVYSSPDIFWGYNSDNDFKDQAVVAKIIGAVIKGTVTSSDAMKLITSSKNLDDLISKFKDLPNIKLWK